MQHRNSQQQKGGIAVHSVYGGWSREDPWARSMLAGCHHSPPWYEGGGDLWSGALMKTRRWVLVPEQVVDLLQIAPDEGGDDEIDQEGADQEHDEQGQHDG